MAVFVVPPRVTLKNFRVSFETAAMLESPSLEAALVAVLDSEVIAAYIMGQLVPRDHETFMGVMARSPELRDEVDYREDMHISLRRDAWRYAFEAMDEVDYMTE